MSQYPELVGAMLWTGEYYSPEYPIRLAAALRRNSSIKKIYCLCDRAGLQFLPDDIEGVEIKPEFVGRMGWWGKTMLFDTDLIPSGQRIVYCDLDNIVVKKMTMIEGCCRLKNEYEIVACEDAIHWLGERFSSTFMCFDSSPVLKALIADRFLADVKKYGVRNFEGRRGGDQVWLGPLISDRLRFVEDISGGRHLNNYKFDLSKKGPTAATEIVAFSGHPKPEHVVDKHDWVREHWRDPE